MIDVDGLRKVYRVHEEEAGLRGSIRAFLARTYRDVAAVDGVSFHVAPGEVVGLAASGRQTWASALGAAGVAIVLLAASQAFWRYALANYTSASS